MFFNPFGDTKITGRDVVQAAVPFVLALSAGALTFGVLVDEYMQHTPYRPDGSHYAGFNTNSLAFLACGVLCYQMSKRLICRPARNYLKRKLSSENTPS